MDRFDQMTTFVRVAELGGSAAAARDLGAAPSAVTTHIQALERRLGARLLNRNTRHVKPTEVGEAYYRYCLDVLNRLEQAENLVESMQGKPRGVLRLNTSVLVANLITPVIADYTAQFPDVSIRLIATGRHVDFIEEQFDVSIRHSMPDNDSLIVRKRRMRNYTRDEGGPFDVGNRVLISRDRKPIPSAILGKGFVCDPTRTLERRLGGPNTAGEASEPSHASLPSCGLAPTTFARPFH